jgi:neutral ceramidase
MLMPCFLAVALLTRTAGTDDLRAGVAVEDITPPAGWRLADSFYDRPSAGIHDPLYAKALVFEQGGQSLALVVCDLTGVCRDVTDRARAEASRQTGIPVDRIVIGATHTHGAPLHYGYLRDLFHRQAVARHGKDPHETLDYPRLLADRCVRAVVRARSAVRPVRLAAGVAKQHGLAFNRRFHMKNGTVQFNPGKRNPNILRPAGPTDPDLHLLLVRDAATDRPVAGLSVFAMHVATFGGQIGADFPMHLQERLREKLGKDFVSVFGEGTAGDVNHIDVGSDRPQTSDAEPPRIGAALAETYLKALPGLHPLKSPDLATRSTKVMVPLQEVTDAQVAKARELLDRTGPAIPEFLVLVESERVVGVHDYRRRFGANLPSEVQAFRLDADTAVVTLPHEVFVELGLAIKQASPFRNTFVLSLCNDVDFYVPTKRAFAEGSYEVVNSRIKPGGGELLVEAALQLLKDLKPR